MLLNCMIGVGRGDVDLKTDQQNSHYTTGERNAANNDQELRYGTTGQVLTSGGYGNPLKWTTPNTLSLGASNPVYYEATLQNGRITGVSIQSNATDAGRTAGTYTVSGTATGSGSDQLLNVTVDANGTVSASGITIVNSGKNFTTSDTITISSQTLGGTTNLVLSVSTVTDLKIQCASQPGFVDLTSWHVPSSSNLVSHSSAFAFNDSRGRGFALLHGEVAQGRRRNGTTRDGGEPAHYYAPREMEQRCE